MNAPLRIGDSEAMHRFGAALAGLLRAGDVLVLTGPLGAGKTTLARGLGEALGVRGPVTSPTFVLARTHPSLIGGPPLIHVDAYRLRDALELEDLDLDLAASVTVIEWGRALIGDLADSWLDVELERPRATAASGGSDAAGGPAAVPGPDGSEPEHELSAEEPRTVRLRPVGERWVNEPRLSELAARWSSPADAD